MLLHRLYPVIECDDVAEAADFWVDHFGFERTFADESYVSLRRTGPPDVELAFLRYDHPTIPEGHREPARGVLLNLEVEDVDAQWRRIVVDGGIAPLLSLRSEEFGQRHFIVGAPGGVMVDVITEIPPEGDFVDKFTDLAATPAAV